MKNQLHVGTKADLSFDLRHFWPMKSFKGQDFREKLIVFSRFLMPYNHNDIIVIKNDLLRFSDVNKLNMCKHIEILLANIDLDALM